jgi:hypothetical protein
MKKLLITILTFAFHAPLGFVNAMSPRPALFLANILEPETNEGSRSYKLDAALATRHLLHKAGTDSEHITPCTANAIPIGTVPDEGDAAELDIEVKLLGSHKRTMIMIASEAIAANVAVFTAAGGKIQDLPAGAGTYYQVGYSLTAGTADGSPMEIQHCAPIKTVVP